MTKADLLITNIGQLVTCAAYGRPKRALAMRDVGIIEKAAVAIIDGMIAAAGSEDEITGSFNTTEMIDAGGHSVCPAFVDPHTHIVFAGDRLDEFELKIKGAEYLEILKTGGGIISTVRKTREASEEELIDDAMGRLDKMLACGTGTAEIKTGYGLDTETEMKMLRVIEALDERHPIRVVPTFLGAHALPPEFKDDPDGYVELICEEMLPKAWEWYQGSRFRAAGTPFFVDVFCERNAFSLEQARRVLESGKKLGFEIKAHVDQFSNLGGSDLAIAADAVSIDHLDAISDAEIERLAKSDTIGVVIPTENFAGGKTKFADARRMIDAGCAVAITTDYNPGSAPCPSQQMAMAIACRYQKLMPAEVFNAATMNAAYAVGLGKERGSIEAGKSADLLILDTTDYREAVYEFGGNLVRQVILSGSIVDRGRMQN